MSVHPSEPQLFLAAVESPQMPIAESLAGELVTIAGVARSLRVAPWAGQFAAEAVVADRSGDVVLRFTEPVVGVVPGERVVATGFLTRDAARLVICDPTWRADVSRHPAAGR